MVRGFEKGRRVALLINECQRGVVEERYTDFPGLVEQFNKRGVAKKIAALAQAFRSAGQRVVYVNIGHQPDYADVPKTSLIMALGRRRGGMKIGSEEVETIAELTPQPTDIVHSRGFSLIGFHGTDLDTRLRHMGISTVVLTGVSADVAIPGLGLYASDLGYQVVVPEDCIAGSSPETHNFIVKNTLPLFTTVTDSKSVIEAVKDL